jgi:hypothetical protein
MRAWLAVQARRAKSASERRERERKNRDDQISHAGSATPTSPLPHSRRDWAHPCHIRDWAHPCHIRAGIGRSLPAPRNACCAPSLPARHRNARRFKSSSSSLRLICAVSRQRIGQHRHQRPLRRAGLPRCGTHPRARTTRYPTLWAYPSVWAVGSARTVGDSVRLFVCA